MDAADLRRPALAARQFSVQVSDGVSLTLVDLTRLQMRLALLEAIGAGQAQRMDSAAQLRYRRLELLRAVAGWSGVRDRHIAPQAPADEPVPFDADLVELLLDAQPEWEDTLSAALGQRAHARAEALDTAAKN